MMKEEETLCLVKPCSFKAGHTGEILSILESNGLEIIELKTLNMTRGLVDAFYVEHLDKLFFPDLQEFMMSGTIVAVRLRGVDAVAHYRELIGATDPDDAKEGTLRKIFAQSKSRNAVHGSDSLSSAKRELDLLFGRKKYKGKVARVNQLRC